MNVGAGSMSISTDVSVSSKVSKQNKENNIDPMNKGTDGIITDVAENHTVHADRSSLMLNLG
jgi:hypothetical protein